MKRLLFQMTIVLVVLGLIVSCGGIRYSQVDPAAKNFKPKSILVVPAEVGTYEEARGKIELVIAGYLVERKWFADVVAGESAANMLNFNDEFRRTMVDYTTKLKMVNYSDPILSAKIGELAKVDAILLTNVDYWLYTKENNKKIAKVGVGFKIVEAKTGRIMWKAGHHLDYDYTFIFRAKPKLEDIAKDLVKLMFKEMPH